MVEFPALGKEYFVPTRWIEIQEIIGIGYRNLQAGSGIEYLCPEILIKARGGKCAIFTMELKYL